MMRGVGMLSWSSLDILNLSVGLGCGLCVGWLLRSKYNDTKYIGNRYEVETSVSADQGETKLVIVVRNDLKMGKGKVAAQCSHAAVMAYERLSRINPTLLHEWRFNGQPKVVVKVDNEAMLLELAEKTRSLGLLASLVQDAGRTQIAPGSKTVLGVGPGSSHLIDQVTGHLRLY